MLELHIGYDLDNCPCTQLNTLTVLNQKSTSTKNSNRHVRKMLKAKKHAAFAMETPYDPDMHPMIPISSLIPSPLNMRASSLHGPAAALKLLVLSCWLPQRHQVPPL